MEKTKDFNIIKQEKGITLVSLIITIVIMVIISSVGIYTSLDRFKLNKLKKMYNDIDLLSSKVSNYYLKYNGIPIVRYSDNNPVEYTYTALEFGKNENDNDKYYILDLEAMEGISLNYGKEGFKYLNLSEDVYIINEKTHYIYYVAGIEVDGIYYHSIVNDNDYNDTIPPTKPQINVVSGEKDEEGNYTSDVSIEIIPGKDNISGIAKTTYAINDAQEKEVNTLPNNILTITENGTYNIKVRSYDESENENVSELTEMDIILKNTDVYFMTKWDVTLGETEGSETYSTVVLPVHKNSAYDATIYWGDGTSTLLQHKTNGITLTDAELKEKVTHKYTLAENESAVKTIGIDGTYSAFAINSTTSTPTKLKLIGIEQWGNVGLKDVSFQNCTNLGGIVPKNDLTQLDCTSYCFAGTSITGLEEGFCFKGGRFDHSFRYCSKLEIIPSSFKIPEGTTSMYGMFRGCSSFKELPDDFQIPYGVTTLFELFYQCSNLKEIPDSFKIPESVNSVGSIFAGCSNLEKIPSDFSLPQTITGAGVANLFNGCEKLTQIPDDFVLPDGITSVQGMFGGAGIKKLPNNFKIPYGVTTMNNTFCNSKIEELPENLEIPETITDIYNAFRGCGYLKGTITIKANPSNYTSCFSNGTAQKSGGTLIVNYSKNCTNIDEILATGNSTYVVKGSQID